MVSGVELFDSVGSSVLKQLQRDLISLRPRISVHRWRNRRHYPRMDSNGK